MQGGLGTFRSRTVDQRRAGRAGGLRLPRTTIPAAGHVDAPTGALLVALVVLAGRAVLSPVLGDAANALASTLSEVATAALACIAVVLGLPAATRAHRHYGLRVLGGLVIMLGLSVAQSAREVLPTDEWALLAMFAAAAALTMYQLTPLVFRGLSRPVLVAASLDAVIFFAAGLAVAGSVGNWFRVAISDATIAVLACVIAMEAWTATSATVLFVRGVRSGFGGPFFMLAGLSLVAAAGALWIAAVDEPGFRVVAVTDMLFSVGVVMIARGWLTWSLDTSDRRSAWAMELGRDLASTAAVMVAIIVVVLGPHTGSLSKLGIVGETALLVGVVAAGVRQVAIKEYERRSRLAEAATSAQLVSEISDRGRVSHALAGVEPGPTTAATARRICERLVGLPNADVVVVTALADAGEEIALGAAGLQREFAGTRIDGLDERLRHARAADGVWSEPAARWLEPWLCGDAVGLAIDAVHAPLIWDEHLLGILTIGSLSRDDAQTAERRAATAHEAGVLVAALVGPALAAEMAARRRRERIDRVIGDAAFHPVFQPIVDLATEAVVGFEALTRFDDGARPDLWFNEAVAAGRGLELEVATLAAAVRESDVLPAGCYLSLNLSPDLASSAEVLGGLLTRLPRQVLLEITEHVPVEDYERMMATLYALDIRIRLAVDDAGAGYAGLQHILAIRPHVVKLDTALVRSVDTDLARQALVGAMVSFAARTGCTIVAEGVETASEAESLRSLGVQLAQGYLFGRPRAAAEWAAEF